MYLILFDVAFKEMRRGRGERKKERRERELIHYYKAFIKKRNGRKKKRIQVQKGKCFFFSILWRSSKD